MSVVEPLRTCCDCGGLIYRSPQGLEWCIGSVRSEPDPGRDEALIAFRRQWDDAKKPAED